MSPRNWGLRTFTCVPHRAFANPYQKRNGVVLGWFKVADGEGFEPSLPIKVNTLSKRARSTTLPPILI